MCLISLCVYVFKMFLTYILFDLISEFFHVVPQNIIMCRYVYCCFEYDHEILLNVVCCMSAVYKLVLTFFLLPSMTWVKFQIYGEVVRCILVCISSADSHMCKVIQIASPCRQIRPHSQQPRVLNIEVVVLVCVPR